MHPRHSAPVKYDITVGLGMPAATDLIINFHVRIDTYDWIDAHRYQELLEMENCILSSNQKRRIADEDIEPEPPFPRLSNEEVQSFIAMLTDVEFDPESVPVLEKLRIMLEDWTNWLLSDYPEMDESCQQVVKQLFFKSEKKLRLYEELVCDENDVDHQFSWGDNVAHSILHLFKKKKSKRKNHHHHAHFEAFDESKDAMSLNAKNLRTLERRLSNANEVGPDGGGGNGANIVTTSGAGARETASENGAGLAGGSASDVGKQMKKKKKRTLFGGFTIGGGSRQAKTERTISEKPVSKHSGEETSVVSSEDTRLHTRMLKVSVQRGQEMSHGILEYEINLRVVGDKINQPISYNTHQRFRKFRELKNILDTMSEKIKAPDPHESFMLMMKCPFPTLPSKVCLGISLSESDLSYRTRMLDAWFRELCRNYRFFPSTARAAIRVFLNFNMTRALDIFIQSQLSCGAVEAPRVDGSVIVIQQKALDCLPPDLRQRLEAAGAVGGSASAVAAAAAAAATPGSRGGTVAGRGYGSAGGSDRSSKRELSGSSGDSSASRHSSWGRRTTSKDSAAVENGRRRKGPFSRMKTSSSYENKPPRSPSPSRRADHWLGDPHHPNHSSYMHHPHPMYRQVTPMLRTNTLNSLSPSSAEPSPAVTRENSFTPAGAGGAGGGTSQDVNAPHSIYSSKRKNRESGELNEQLREAVLEATRGVSTAGRTLDYSVLPHS